MLSGARGKDPVRNHDLSLLPELCARLADAADSRIRGTRCEIAAVPGARGADERRDEVRLGKIDRQTQDCAAGEPEQDMGRVCWGRAFGNRGGCGTLVGNAVYAARVGGNVADDRPAGRCGWSGDERDQARRRGEGLWFHDRRPWRHSRSHRFAVFRRADFLSPRSVLFRSVMHGKCCCFPGVFNCRGYDGVSETQGDRQRWIRLDYWRNTDGYRVAEIVADRRLQNLRNQVGHGAEPRNHFRSVVARNVNDLAHVQVEGESIRGAHRDRRELLVELVRLGRREGGDPGERAGPPADTCIPAGRLARYRFGAVPGAWTDRYGTERRWGLHVCADGADLQPRGT